MVEHLSDYELRPAPDQLPPQRSKASKLWIVAALLVAVAGATIYILNTRPAVPPPADESSVAPTPAGPAADSRTSLGGDPMAIDLPPIDQSDALVRTLVSALSSHPSVAAWLVTDGLVRNFTVVVANIAEGEPPAVHLSRLRPSTRFQVLERNGNLTIDPRSYERYTPLAAAVSAIDPAGSARLYATLKPLIEQAHRDLGYGNTSFDATLERAIVNLLSTPAVGDPVHVVPHGIVYAFADPRIEKLTPGQKHLLRFGPRNVPVVQQALRNIARALGIPEERLPD
ncbi:MAG: DUF3014 domain-containing protein [Acidobacteria bacterium]|nr:MAG: DUF3014 domain-containing protein [Acidobacteriota bacterium]